MTSKKYNIQSGISAISGFAYFAGLSFFVIFCIGLLLNYLFHPKYFIKFDFKGEHLIQYLDVMPTNFMYFLHEILLLALYIGCIIILLIYLIEYVFGWFHQEKIKTLREDNHYENLLELTHEEKREILESSTIGFFLILFLIFAFIVYAYFFPWEGIIDYLPGFLSSILRLVLLWPITLFLLAISYEKILVLVGKHDFLFEKIRRSVLILLCLIFVGTITTFFLQKNHFPGYDMNKLIGHSDIVLQENDGIRLIGKGENIFIPVKIRVNETTGEFSGVDYYGNEQSWTEEEYRYYSLGDFLEKYYILDEDGGKDFVKNYQDCLENMQDDYKRNGYKGVYGCNTGSEQEAIVYEPYHLLSAYIKFASKYININSQYTGGIKYKMLGTEIY